ncbi:Uncharacterised protein [Bifidobacterium bifidum]|nr:Uncharacterised protein [Bifidobacterium bifidum]
MVHVGTTAQLTAPAVFADGHHAHDVAIFLAEQVHGTEGDGIVELHFLGGHGEVVAQLVVDALLNSGNHGLGRSLGPLEIETQTVRGVFGTTLSGLRAELFAQRLVYHVRGGVRTGNGATAGQIDVRIDFSAHDQRAFSQAALVNDEVLDGLLHVVDFEHGAVIGENLTLIGKLTAGLRIERGTVEDDLDVGRAGHGGHGALAFLHDADHLGTGGHVRVAEEVDRLGERLLEVVIDRQVHVVTLLEGVGAGTGLLLGHKLAELGLVDFHSLVGGHFESQLDREAVGVVQSERIRAGDHRVGGLLGLLDGHVENLDAVLQRTTERIFLAVGRFGDIVEGVVKLRVAGDHGLLGDGQQLGNHRIGHAKHAHGLHSTTQQTPQHVAAADVGRAHAIGHNHQRGTHVVGHDTELDIRGLVLAVLAAGQALGGLDDREDLVGLIDVLFALHQVGQTFQTGAGIDVLLGQLADDVQVGLGLDIVDLVVLEHEIPNFDKARLVGRRAAITAVFGAAIHVDLGAGAAGARAAGGPEVVFHAENLHVLGIKALVLPDGTGFLVVGKGGDPQLSGSKP